MPLLKCFESFITQFFLFFINRHGYLWFHTLSTLRTSFSHTSLRGPQVFDYPFPSLLQRLCFMTCLVCLVNPSFRGESLFSLCTPRSLVSMFLAEHCGPIPLDSSASIVHKRLIFFALEQSLSSHPYHKVPDLILRWKTTQVVYVKISFD